MDELARRVRDYWAQVNAQALPGASDAALAAFERRHDVQLPATLRALYADADGNMGDENLTRLWPLDEVCRLGDVPEVRDALGELPSEARDCFAFADYMIFSHVYAVRLTAEGRDGPVWWVLPSEPPAGVPRGAEVAPTFEAFLRAYVEDPDSLLFPTEIG